MNFSSSVCGIVAEYNPFHSGHRFHIERTREMLGEHTIIVCAMSGNFVQRGDFALLDKYARAEMAVRGGADLVLELPLAAALSSAEGFAQGAVALLHKIGCDTLSFGAENGLPFETFTAAQLQNAPGEFTASEFVRSTVGVDSVCERAAVLASGNGSILLRKYAKNGVTAALAVQERRFCFED